MANTDTLKGKLETIAGAIRTKTGGAELLTIDEMPTEILSIDGGNAPNPDDPLLLIDWDGTLLYSYTAAEVPLISEFPGPPTHELLTFQEWSCAEVIAKTWVQKHPNGQLKVGAIYKSSDNQDHNYWHSPSWRNPSLSDLNAISMQKRATTNIADVEFSSHRNLVTINIPKGATLIGNNAFYRCYSLSTVILPRGLTTIDYSAFSECYSLSTVILPDTITSIGSNAFQNCSALSTIILPNQISAIAGAMFRYCSSLSRIEIPASAAYIGAYAFDECLSLVDVVLHGKPTLGGSAVFYTNPSIQRIYVHRSDLAWFSTATNWSAIYGEGKIVAAADYISYLQSIGIDTSDFEGE